MRYYCAGMIRSGSTWQYNVTAELLEHCGKIRRVGFAESDATLRRWLSEHTDAVIKIHDPYEAAIADVMSGQGCVVYIYRDLRDVAASLMQYETRGLHEILDTGRLDLAWRNHEVWSDLAGALVQQYEHVMADQVSAVEQIAAFLELEIEPEQIRAIAHRNSLEARRRERAARRSFLDPWLYRTRAIAGRALRKAVGRERTRRLANRFGYLGGRGVDQHTQLHSDHIANGTVGAFRQVMTPDEQSKIELAVSQITGGQFQEQISCQTTTNGVPSGECAEHNEQ